MRIKATHKKAELVEAVLVNGKVVKMPFELDTVEGWVDAHVPKMFGGTVLDSDTPGKFDMNPGKFEYDLVRFEGIVEVIWKKEVIEE